MLKRKRIIKVIILFCISYIVFISCNIYFYGNKDQVRKADVAIVLGAGVFGKEPSPVFRERIKHAIWLYKNKFVKKLIFTGGKGKGKKYSEANVAKNYALKNSIPCEDIFTEELSTITRENLLYASKILKENNLDSVILVSDPLHMKRAMLMAKDCGLNALSSPTPTSRYISMKSKLSFLAREVFFYTAYIIYRISI